MFIASNKTKCIPNKIITMQLLSAIFRKEFFKLSFKSFYNVILFQILYIMYILFLVYTSLISYLLYNDQGSLCRRKMFSFITILYEFCRALCLYDLSFVAISISKSHLLQ